MFVSGALLAEISLVMNATKTGGARPRQPWVEGESLWRRWVWEYWPLGMAALALYLASCPPENQTYAAYSRQIFFFFDDYITTEGGTTLFIRSLTVGETDRTIGAIAGILMILSILYSPLLRSVLSRRIPVFLGSISFSLYLLHGTFIRLPLTYILFKFLARYPSLNIIYIAMGWEDEEVIIWGCESVRCKFVVGLTLILWFMALLATCKIWQKYIDVLGIQFSRWVEDIVLGKRELQLQIVNGSMLGEIPRPSWMKAVSNGTAPQVLLPHRTDPEKFS